jgi:hypothetical protein
MKIPVFDNEAKTILLKEYDVALVSGTIRVYAAPSWPCGRKDDMSIHLETYLDTANGVRYRLVEEKNE